MRPIVLVMLAALAGCATLGQPDAPDPEDVLGRALVSLEQEDFTAAYEQLSWLYQSYWDEPAGERALLALTAVELDPRNPGRRLYAAADLASRHYQLPSVSPWALPVSQTLYLLAQELGAAEEELERSRREKERAVQAQVEAQAEARREAAAAGQARAEAARAREEATQARATARRAQAAAAEPRPLPRLPGPSVSARVSELQGERDRLADELRTLRSRLAEREEELERIRQTIIPR